MGIRMLVRSLVLFGLSGCAGLPHAPSPARARQMIAGQSAIPAVDLIIVHGCPARPDGSASTCNQRRTRAAVEAYRRGLAPRILFTGGAVLNRFPESRVMAAYARTLGLPGKAILTEEESHHTVTNLSVAKGIMKKQGFTTAIQVSESMHLVWAKQLAEFYGMHTWLYPADMVPPYTAAYLRDQPFDEEEPWKTQTGVYGMPQTTDAGSSTAGSHRVACIVVGERAALGETLARLESVPGLEVQRVDWSPTSAPSLAADDLVLWVRAWTRGFNGRVDEVVVIGVGGAGAVTEIVSHRIHEDAVPLRFEETDTGGIAAATLAQAMVVQR